MLLSSHEFNRQQLPFPLDVFVLILAIKANSYEEGRQSCFDAGMNDFISKPVDPDLLFMALVKWLQISGLGADKK